MQGARVFDLNLDTLDNIPTHVTRLQSLNKPVEPDLYDTLADNVTLEFTAEAIQNVAITNWNGGALNGKATVSIHPGAGVGGSEAIQVTRNNKENMEFVLDISNPGKLGNNKYLVVWADFSNVEFRKACFGLNTPDGYYRTDDADYKTPFYYLPDGVTDLSQAETLSHGFDGCFGSGDSGYDKLDRKEWMQWILSKVNETERALLLLRYRDGLGQRETAKKLGVSEMQVSRLERRVLSRLRAIEMQA